MAISISICISIGIGSGRIDVVVHIGDDTEKKRISDFGSHSSAFQELRDYDASSESSIHQRRTCYERLLVLFVRGCISNPSGIIQYVTDVDIDIVTLTAPNNIVLCSRTHTDILPRR